MKQAMLVLTGVVFILSSLIGPPSSVAAQEPETVLVFIKGYMSSSDDYTFFNLQQTLLGRGRYSKDQMINFSYQGGIVYDGPYGQEWYSNPYSCYDTWQPIEQSYQKLRQLLMAQTYLRGHPVRYILIGHSFGGLLAWWHLLRMYQRGDSGLGVAGVLSIDSPLHGLSDGRISTFKRVISDCISDAPDSSMWQMGEMRRVAGEVAATWQSVGQFADALGVSTRTLGNSYDCVYWPAMNHCGLGILMAGSSDDRFSQVIQGRGIMMSVVPPLNRRESAGAYIGKTHSALLNDVGAVEFIVADIGTADARGVAAP